MPSIYVLDVPEFAMLIEVSRANSAYRVTDLGKQYVRISSDDELVFQRKDLDFRPAIWYGAFTAGIDGEIAEFGRDTVRIVARAGHDH